MTIELDLKDSVIHCIAALQIGDVVAIRTAARMLHDAYNVARADGVKMTDLQSSTLLALLHRAEDATATQRVTAKATEQLQEPTT